jgi:hypothetical protein
MGQDWRPNQALTVELMVALLDLAKTRITQAVSEEDGHRWVVFHTYATISNVISLRGVEGMLLDLEALNRYWGSGRAAPKPYVVIPLKGQFKGESHHFCHLIPGVASCHIIGNESGDNFGPVAQGETMAGFCRLAGNFDDAGPRLDITVIG